METTSKLPFAKGTGKVIEQEVQIPWSEKYRPQTLDDIAAHNDIISTSKFCYVYSVYSCNELEAFYCLMGPNILFSIFYSQLKNYSTKTSFPICSFMDPQGPERLLPYWHWLVKSMGARLEA